MAGDSPTKDTSDAQNMETVPVGEFGNLTVADEGGVSVKAELSGEYSSDPTKAREVKGFSPGSERHQSQFVKGNHDLDDPFNSATRNEGPLAGKRRAMSDNWRSTSSSDADSSPPLHGKSGSAPGSIVITSTSADQAALNSPDLALAHQPMVTNQNAQTQFPIECCVFVANLLQSESEENLQASITRVFRQYGPVWVNVKRDKTRMPFAFCTFSLPEHAERAIREGNGRYINGRPCRCEQARGHRFFFLGRRYGAAITTEEAMDLLKSYGPIRSCRAATDIDRACLNLNEGVLVEFSMYPQGQAALATFRNHEVYKMVDLAEAMSPLRRGDRNNSSANQAQVYNAAYEQERCTIFVGNLPAEITEPEIDELFRQYGSILDISIRDCFSKYNPNQKLCIAFVKYASPLAVNQAIQGKNGYPFGDGKLRVSPKNSERNPHHRQSPPSASRFHSTPVRRHDPSSQAQVTPSPHPSRYTPQQVSYATTPGYTQQPVASYTPQTASYAYSPQAGSYAYAPGAYVYTPQHSYGYAAPHSTPIYGAQGIDGTQYYSGVPVYTPAASQFYTYPAGSAYAALPPYFPYNSTAQQGMASPPATQYHSGNSIVDNSDRDDGSTTPTRASYASGGNSSFQSQ